MAHSTNDLQAIQQTAGDGVLTLVDSSMMGGFTLITIRYHQLEVDAHQSAPASVHGLVNQPVWYHLCTSASIKRRKLSLR